MSNDYKSKFQKLVYLYLKKHLDISIIENLEQNLFDDFDKCSVIFNEYNEELRLLILDYIDLEKYVFDKGSGAYIKVKNLSKKTRKLYLETISKIEYQRHSELATSKEDYRYITEFNKIAPPYASSESLLMFDKKLVLAINDWWELQIQKINLSHLNIIDKKVDYLVIQSDLVKITATSEFANENQGNPIKEVISQDSKINKKETLLSPIEKVKIIELIRNEPEITSYNEAIKEAELRNKQPFYKNYNSFKKARHNLQEFL